MRLAGPGSDSSHSLRDQALLLEAPQHAVEVADVDALLADQLGQALEQVVAVRRALAQEQQERGDLEALDPALRVHRRLATSIHM